jgi:hypothetical protein
VQGDARVAEPGAGRPPEGDQPVGTQQQQGCQAGSARRAQPQHPPEDEGRALALRGADAELLQAAQAPQLLQLLAVQAALQVLQRKAAQAPARAGAEEAGRGQAVARATATEPPSARRHPRPHLSMAMVESGEPPAKRSLQWVIWSSARQGHSRAQGSAMAAQRRELRCARPAATHLVAPPPCQARCPESPS